MKTKNALLFKRLNSETEEILLEHLEVLKGGGNSDDPIDGGDLEEVVITPDDDDDPPLLDPDPEPDPDDPWDDDDPWDEDDYTGGGYDGEEEEEEEKDPCKKAKALGEKANNLINSSAFQQAMAQSLQIPTALGKEVNFSVTRDADGNIDATIPTLGDAWGVATNNGADSIADFHTHPYSNHPPGGADIMTFLRDTLYGSPNMEMSIVRTQDGTLYALQITDRSLMADFLSDNLQSVDIGAGHWKEGSTLGIMFDGAQRAFIDQGMSAMDAFARATSYIAERAGLTLFKADPTQVPNAFEGFKKIGVESIVDQDGNLSFQTADCPN